jgi:hypothetical protein
MTDKHQSLARLATVLTNVAFLRQQELTPMNSRDFMYWLRGYMESNGTTGLTQSKVALINDHLTLAIQTEATTKHLNEEMMRANIAKTFNDAGEGHRMSHHMAAGC